MESRRTACPLEPGRYLEEVSDWASVGDVECHGNHPIMSLVVRILISCGGLRENDLPVVAKEIQVGQDFWFCASACIPGETAR
jgi:hypothetical protein